MKKSRLCFSTLLLVFGFGTALAQEVNVEWDADTNFSKYKTYKWEEGTPLGKLSCGKELQRIL